MIQHSLDIGILVTWTKTFNCPDAVNKDAVRLLREALDRRGDTKVKVVAILNDTTGTLVQGSTLDPNTAIGLILGTGSNACYLERADRVEHWETERHGEREVILFVRLMSFYDIDLLHIKMIVVIEGNHRHRMGCIWGQRCLRLHQDRLRSRERREFSYCKFIYVSSKSLEVNVQIVWFILISFCFK